MRGFTQPLTTVASLKRFRAAGGRLLLISGRQLDDLFQVFPSAELFDRIVAEDGALLYDPANQELRQLASPPSADFLAQLKQMGVAPLSCGRVIVATSEPHGATVETLIRERSLPLHVSHNKGAVMILPTGIDKAHGLEAALAGLAVGPEAVVGIGDAENDLAFLERCALFAVVGNALATLKAKADRTSSATHGEGVIELIDWLLAADAPAG